MAKKLIIFPGRGRIHELSVDFSDDGAAKSFYFGFRKYLKSNPHEETFPNPYITRGYHFAFLCKRFCIMWGIDETLLLQARLVSAESFTYWDA